MSLKKYLIQEAVLLDIDEDVEYIYNNWGFKEFIDNFQKYKNDDDVSKIYIKFFTPNLIKYLKDGTSFISFKNVSKAYSSEELPSDLSKQAHEKNPIHILVGIANTSHYDPKKNKMVLGLSKSALEVYLFPEIDIERDLTPSSKRALENALTEKRVKATIKHELSHWIRDSIHNKHITKILKRVEDFENKSYTFSKINKLVKKHKNLGNEDVYQTYYEIDAIVHSLDAIKKTMTDEEWNNLSMVDLSYMYGGIGVTIQQLLKKGKPNEARKFIKLLTKKMHRAGILGNNMRKFDIYDLVHN